MPGRRCLEGPLGDYRQAMLLLAATPWHSLRRPDNCLGDRADASVCVNGGDIEARFLAAFEATRSWGLDSGKLHLRDAEGDTVATLEHRETLPDA